MSGGFKTKGAEATGFPRNIAHYLLLCGFLKLQLSRAVQALWYQMVPIGSMNIAAGGSRCLKSPARDVEVDVGKRFLRTSILD